MFYFDDFEVLLFSEEDCFSSGFEDALLDVADFAEGHLQAMFFSSIKLIQVSFER